GWPTSRQEAWRHTSLAVLEQQSFLDAGKPSVAQFAQQLRGDEPGHWLVFVDGRHAPELSDVGPLPQGARVQPLSEALEQVPEQVEAAFGNELEGSSTAALNTALAADGAFISLARGVALDRPVHLLFIAASQQAASFPRNLIVAEAAASAVVVEHYVGQASGASLTNTVTRAKLAADAHVTHLKLQQEDPQAFHLGAVSVEQAKGSVYNSHSMSFGARLARHDVATRFLGGHCETLLNGLYHV